MLRKLRITDSSGASSPGLFRRKGRKMSFVIKAVRRLGIFNPTNQTHNSLLVPVLVTGVSEFAHH